MEKLIEKYKKKISNTICEREKAEYTTIIEALETQIAKKVSIINGSQVVCPECMCNALSYYSYCPDCGQKLCRE